MLLEENISGCFYNLEGWYEFSMHDIKVRKKMKNDLNHY